MEVDGRQSGLALRASGLVKKYRKRKVVDGVELEVGQGEVVGLLGPNGAGKTTTFYMIVGMIRPNEGRIYLGDEDITGLPMYRRARKGIGYLAQEESVFRNLTVEDNITAVLEFQPISRAERRRRVERLIEEFGLARVRQSKGYMLSGGERRRTEIARALATEPRFILLDEPFAGIDPIAVYEVQKIVRRLKQRGLGILITDHNVRETLRIVDRAYLIFEGRVLSEGTSEFLIKDPQSRKFYLGENFNL
jgi:lipopolysaccharide export system ATP-binding protein